jgi:hypothetical protein
MSTYKLQKQGLFATPKSTEALMEYVNLFNGSERTVAMTLLGMTWNLCAELTKEDEDKEPIK